MISKVQEIKLGDVLLSLKTGLNPRQNFSLNTPESRNWYITVRELNGTGVDFLPQTDKVDDEGLRLINNRSNLEINDVLFSGTGTIGKTAIIQEHPNNWNIKEGVYVLKPNKKVIDPYYLLCQLRYYSRINVFSRKTGGSTVFSIPMQVLADTSLYLPDLDTQKKISKIIKEIDEKIALNNKLNSELLQTAQLIYNYWFTQFDFPNTQGNPYKESGGSLTYHPHLKINIPTSWNVKEIGRVLKTELGGTPATKNNHYWESGNIPWVNSGEVSAFPVTKTELKITPEGLKNSAAKLLPRHTVILSIVRHIRVSFLATDASTNQSVVGIAESEALKYPYIFLSIQRDIPRLMSRRGGAQQPHINKDEVDKSLIIIPDKLTLTRFNTLVEPLFRQIEYNALQNDQLEEYRDWILPMLMTGQVQVK